MEAKRPALMIQWGAAAGRQPALTREQKLLRRLAVSMITRRRGGSSNEIDAGGEAALGNGGHGTTSKMLRPGGLSFSGEDEQPAASTGGCTTCMISCPRSSSPPLTAGPAELFLSICADSSSA